MVVLLRLLNYLKLVIGDWLKVIGWWLVTNKLTTDTDYRPQLPTPSIPVRFFA